MARSAHHEAVRYFEQALHALAHLPQTRNTREQAIDLRLSLRSALHPTGDLGRAKAYLKEAEILAAALDDPRRLGHVSVHLSLHFYLMGAYDQAIAAAQRALALAAASGEAALPLLANLHLGIAYQTKGDYRHAIDCLSQTLTPSTATSASGSIFWPCSPLRTSLRAMPNSARSPREGQSGMKGSRLPRRLIIP